jgi:hypothetical protein
MSARKWPFRLTDARRLVQAAEESKLTVYALRKDPDGTIIVHTQPIVPPAGEPAESGRPNSFDQVLSQ